MSIVPRMPPPQIQNVARIPRRINVEVDPSRETDHSVPTNLMLPTHRIPLVSRLILSPSDIPNLEQVSLKPPSPVLRERAFLKPPPSTMPGSLFPRSPSMIPEFLPSLQTPRIQRVPNNAPPLILKQIDAARTEVPPTMEDEHGEADISSGTLFQSTWCRLF